VVHGNLLEHALSESSKFACLLGWVSNVSGDFPKALARSSPFNSGELAAVTPGRFKGIFRARRNWTW
jgi:hypothetical protein